MQNNPNKINHVEITELELTGRAGMNSVVNFLERTNIISILSEKFSGLEKSSKGLGVYDFFKQVACFFFLGDNLRISEFDRLKNDVGYAKIIETCIEKMGSADAVSRMFDKFNQGEVLKFRDIFEIIFDVIVQKHTGPFISLTLDSMVLDNNDSKNKQGNTPTYKNVLGFQPLHLILNGMIVDMTFRGGSTHGNSEDTALNMIVKAIRTIRRVKGNSYPIIFNMDSGFMDQKLFKAIEENNAFFICSGKKYKSIKESVKSSKDSAWHVFEGKRLTYRFLEFQSKCDSWEKKYRTFYTALEIEENGQMRINFDDSENVIYTNIKKKSKEFSQAVTASTNIIAMHHGRGADELPHRGLKEFGTEIMPFKDYYANHAFYALMVINFNMFELYKREVIQNEEYIGSYANRIRRKFIDIAGYFSKTGHQIILKINKCVADATNFLAIWDRSKTSLLKL
jgi:hypothetical protein